MSRLGLRQIRKPNVKGAAFAAESSPTTSFTHQERVTNGVQTGNKQVTEKPETDNKRVTNGVQTGNKQVTEKPETDNKRVTQRITSNCVNGVQTDNKRVTIQDWKTLRGHESRLLWLIFEECQATGDLLSPPLTLNRIAEHLESRTGTAKTIIARLTQKGFLKREASATGRGGFTRFRLQKDLYQELLIRETEYKRITNGVQTDNKRVTQRVTQRITNAPSSSSFLEPKNLKTTTTETEPKKSDISPLGPDWVDLDYSPLTEIGFTQNHLSQIARQGNLSAAEVQDAIHFFAFDLKRNGKEKEIKGAPINFFMGILRKGIPYAAPENYESPESEARRKYLESKRRLEAEREAQERELQDLEFTEWRRGLSPAELSAIVPEVVRHAPRACESALRTHFDENVWPTRRSVIPGIIDLKRAEIGRQIDQALGKAKE